MLTTVLSLVRNPERGVRSIRRAAAYCGVHDRTVRRWLSDEDYPAEAHLRRLAIWSRQFSRQ